MSSPGKPMCSGKEFLHFLFSMIYATILHFLFSIIYTTRTVCSPGKPMCSGKDRISELPDDIVLDIVSYLPLKEIGRTSVLSKRWKHVSAFNGVLNFDSRKTWFDMYWSPGDGYKYINWIEQVISSCKATTIDEFKVKYDFTSVKNENFNDGFDKWLRFAMEKRVKRLDLYLSMRYEQRYTFSKCLSCESLTSLKLVHVNVTGEVLESFLCNCLALEYLSVKYSHTLVELTVAGPLLKLKSLIILWCMSFEKLEIYAPSLVYVCYFGPEINLLFKSTPKLAQVSIGGMHANNLIHRFSDLSSYLSQVDVLNLSPTSVVILPTEDIVLPRVVKLVVSVYVDGDLYFLGYLMKACPSMLDLRLELNVETRRFGSERDTGLRIPAPFLHHHLKSVEVLGFRGKPIDDIDYIVFVIETAVVLEKITINPCKRCDVGAVWPSEKTPAEEIQPHLKPGIKLEIL